jgi:hypothetical protein
MLLQVYIIYVKLRSAALEHLIYPDVKHFAETILLSTPFAPLDLYSHSEEMNDVLVAPH